MQPYTDRLGRWISAAGPIRDTTGKIVGGMKVYYSEAYLTKVQNYIRNTLVIAYLVIAFWLLVLSGIIVRAMRPIEGDR